MKDVNSKYGLIDLKLQTLLSILQIIFKISVLQLQYLFQDLDFLNKNEYCKNILGFETLEVFVLSIQNRGRPVVMVQAGTATDGVISGPIPFLIIRIL